LRRYPARRLICLTEETVETLYLLGEQDRIVGVSGYAVRPPQVRKEKPRISSFLSADIDRIAALEPDLILAFSDIQAQVVSDLARRGLPVYLFNQRDLAGIFAMIRTLGALIGCPEKAEALASGLEARVRDVASATEGRIHRPRVYFEEWNDPMISGIGWVSELIEIAGGTDIFSDLSKQAAAKDRIVTSEQVIAGRPDVLLASWCGKKVRTDSFKAREGWYAVPAVVAGRIVEIKSPLILQPGPAALTDGLDAIRAALA
jgi:iron complex transport system substrate-binding protein